MGGRSPVSKLLRFPTDRVQEPGESPTQNLGNGLRVAKYLFYQVILIQLFPQDILNTKNRI